MNEFFHHSPSDARGIQPNILSSSLEVHGLKFAGGVTMVGLLCGDGERRMVGRPSGCDTGNAVLWYIRNVAGGSGVLAIGRFGWGGGCGGEIRGWRRGQKGMGSEWFT